jgi:hypothetical protein
MVPEFVELLRAEVPALDQVHQNKIAGRWHDAQDEGLGGNKRRPVWPRAALLAI